MAAGTEVFTFLVLGDQNAGKSTLLHSFTYVAGRVPISAPLFHGPADLRTPIAVMRRLQPRALASMSTAARCYRHAADKSFTELMAELPYLSSTFVNTRCRRQHRSASLTVDAAMTVRIRRIGLVRC